VTLGLDTQSTARLEALRRAHFPPALNRVPAHVSLFHHLPPGEREAVEGALAAAAAATTPLPVRFPRLRRLGRGVAVEVEAPGLAVLHGRLAAAFAPWLTPQDRQPFRPHVTVMNKAPPEEAARTFALLQEGWQGWEGRAEALLLWHYAGGPWEPACRLPFAVP
jgi:2'-5' RNA ligase